MANLNINGQSVTVDDSFLSLPRDEQEKTVNEIAQHIQQPQNQDKYQQAAQSDYDAAQKAGAPTVANPLAAKFTNGRMLGALPTVTAAMETPLEMIKRGTWNPVEGYNYAKAAEDLAMKKAGEQSGWLGTGAEAAGGITTAGQLAKNGMTLLAPNQAFIPRVGALAGEGAGYGAVTGFNSGDGIEDRAKGALKGGLIGGAAGVVIPGALKAIGTAVSPATSYVLSKID